MLSYQHGFHAGGISDVLKHMLLLQVLQYVAQKPTPYLYLDSYAGAGLYQLGGQRHSEYQFGIGQLMAQPAATYADQPLLSAYLNFVAPYWQQQQYPGSVLYALMQARPFDRAYLCELHPREYQQLQQLVAGCPHVSVRQEDGLQALRALLPPRERRAVVLLDPSYETQDSLKQLTSALEAAYAKFPQAVYLIWYPIHASGLGMALRKCLSKLAVGNALSVELRLARQYSRIQGTGLWLINPPYSLQAQVETVLPVLCAMLQPMVTGWHCATLGASPGLT
jgi:23S rRNA (adenine2030-N6)-methyltransferase